MLTLKSETAKLIDQELQSVPERYQKPFNSVHEALGVIREEYIELEQEIFFGEKQVKAELDYLQPDAPQQAKNIKEEYHRRIKKEAVQVAAMCVRLIQEL